MILLVLLIGGFFVAMLYILHWVLKFTVYCIYYLIRFIVFLVRTWNSTEVEKRVK